MHNSKVPGRSVDCVLYGGGKYLCVLSVELPACHLSGTDCFDVAPILSENLFILVLMPLLIIK